MDLIRKKRVVYRNAEKENYSGFTRIEKKETNEKSHLLAEVSENATNCSSSTLPASVVVGTRTHKLTKNNIKICFGEKHSVGPEPLSSQTSGQTNSNDAGKQEEATQKIEESDESQESGTSAYGSLKSGACSSTATERRQEQFSKEIQDCCINTRLKNRLFWRKNGEDQWEWQEAD